MTGGPPTPCGHADAIRTPELDDRQRGDETWWCPTERRHVVRRRFSLLDLVIFLSALAGIAGAFAFVVWGLRG